MNNLTCVLDWLRNHTSESTSHPHWELSPLEWELQGGIGTEALSKVSNMEAHPHGWNRRRHICRMHWYRPHTQYSWFYHHHNSFTYCSFSSSYQNTWDCKDLGDSDFFACNFFSFVLSWASHTIKKWNHGFVGESHTCKNLLAINTTRIKCQLFIP